MGDVINRSRKLLTSKYLEEYEKCMVYLDAQSYKASSKVKNAGNVFGYYRYLDIRCETFSVQTVEEYVEYLGDCDYNPGEITRFKYLMNALSLRVLGGPPLFRHSLYQQVYSPHGERLTDAEVSDLIKNLEDDYKVVINFSRFSGITVSRACKMTFDCVDLEEKTLNYMLWSFTHTVDIPDRYFKMVAKLVVKAKELKEKDNLDGIYNPGYLFPLDKRRWSDRFGTGKICRSHVNPNTIAANVNRLGGMLKQIR